MICSTQTLIFIADVASSKLANRNSAKMKLTDVAVEVQAVQAAEALEEAVALEEEAILSLVKVEKEDLHGQVGSRNRVVVEALNSQLADGAAIDAVPTFCQQRCAIQKTKLQRALP